MHGWVKADKQAASIMKEIQGSVVESVRSVANYEAALKTSHSISKTSTKPGVTPARCAISRPSVRLSILSTAGKKSGKSSSIKSGKQFNSCSSMSLGISPRASG